MKEGTEHVGETLFYTVKINDKTVFNLVLDLTKEYEITVTMEKTWKTVPKVPGRQ